MTADPRKVSAARALFFPMEYDILMCDFVARRLAMILCDTHADTLYSLAMHPRRPCDVTRERAQAGGVSVQTFALYVGGSPDRKRIRRAFDRMLAQADALEKGGWRKLGDYRDARDGECAFLLSVEGCDLLEGDLALLSAWRSRGVRMAAVCWNYENSLGVPAVLDQNAPLTPFGRRAVLEMRRLGIAPDASHLSRRGFYDLLELGLAPAASHSCCDALCPHPRNLTDGQLRALFAAGGYVGVNFYPRFLDPSGAADLDTVCRHVLHMMALGGESHIGFGSDFDGIESKPEGLDGPQCFPALLDALAGYGLSDSQLRALAGENLLRYYDRIDPRT